MESGSGDPCDGRDGGRGAPPLDGEAEGQGKENWLSGNPQVHGQGDQPPTENFSE